jgi:hypothetical protein
MKRNRTGSLLAMALVATTLFVTACAKAPAEEVTSAQSALEQARAAEAEKYAMDSYGAARDSLAAAEAEIQAQNSKFALFRNYDRAKALVASAQTAAAKAQQDAVVNKEAARKAADEALAMATAAVDSANTVLMSAPVGKDNRADIEMMKADLTGAQSSLEDVRTAIAQEDYLGARQTAETINSKAMQIISEVEMARMKVRGGR